jgi:hypothetical protein
MTSGDSPLFRADVKPALAAIDAHLSPEPEVG